MVILKCDSTESPEILSQVIERANDSQVEPQRRSSLHRQLGYTFDYIDEFEKARSSFSMAVELNELGDRKTYLTIGPGGSRLFNANLRVAKTTAGNCARVAGTWRRDAESAKRTPLQEHLCQIPPAPEYFIGDGTAAGVRSPPAPTR